MPNLGTLFKTERLDLSTGQERVYLYLSLKRHHRRLFKLNALVNLNSDKKIAPEGAIGIIIF